MVQITPKLALISIFVSCALFSDWTSTSSLLFDSTTNDNAAHRHLPSDDKSAYNHDMNSFLEMMISPSSYFLDYPDGDGSGVVHVGFNEDGKSTVKSLPDEDNNPLLTKEDLSAEHILKIKATDYIGSMISQSFSSLFVMDGNDGKEDEQNHGMVVEQIKKTTQMFYTSSQEKGDADIESDSLFSSQSDNDDSVVLFAVMAPLSIASSQKEYELVSTATTVDTDNHQEKEEIQNHQHQHPETLGTSSKTVMHRQMMEQQEDNDDDVAMIQIVNDQKQKYMDTIHLNDEILFVMGGGIPSLCKDTKKENDNSSTISWPESIVFLGKETNEKGESNKNVIAWYTQTYSVPLSMLSKMKLPCNDESTVHLSTADQFRMGDQGSTMVLSSDSEHHHMHSSPSVENDTTDHEKMESEHLLHLHHHHDISHQDHENHDHRHHESHAYMMSNLEASSSSFCANPQMSMTIFMDGFQFSFFRSSNACLNLYFPSWTLRKAIFFILAMMGSFVISFFMEYLFVLRMRVHRQYPPGKKRKAIKVVLHVLQELLGYLIMLVAMMYSIEMLFSVLFGLMVGYGLFMESKKTTRAVVPNDVEQRDQNVV